MGNNITHFPRKSTNAEGKKAKRQKLNHAHNESLGLRGTEPRGRPAGSGRGWGEAE